MSSDDYPPPADMPATVAVIWTEIVQAHVDAGDPLIGQKVGPRMEAFCAITADLRDATARVAKDGLLVQNARGEPTPHPAIAIKNDASRELARYGSEFRPKQARPRRTR